MSRQYLHDELVSAADQLYSIVVHELKRYQVSKQPSLYTFISTDTVLYAREAATKSHGSWWIKQCISAYLISSHVSE